MAIKTDKETGRPNRSYKTLYLDLQKKYSELLEKKVGISQPQSQPQTPTSTTPAPPSEEKDGLVNNDIKPKKEGVETLKPVEASLDNQPQQNPKDIPPLNSAEKEDTSDTSAPKPEVAPSEETPEEDLKIEKEPEEEEFDFCCPNCKEMFNKSGDEIKCPDCSEVFDA